MFANVNSSVHNSMKNVYAVKTVGKWKDQKKELFNFTNL
jgi:hypothetical protein